MLRQLRAAKAGTACGRRHHVGRAGASGSALRNDAMAREGAVIASIRNRALS